MDDETALVPDLVTHLFKRAVLSVSFDDVVDALDRADIDMSLDECREALIQVHALAVTP